jgi:hypothetical protein
MGISPKRTSDRLLEDPSRLRLGILAWLLLSVLYGLAAFIGGLNGLGAVTQPYLPIPAEKYYLWMGPFTPVIFLVVFALLAGLIQLGSRFFAGRGAFEDTFVSVVFSFWLPLFVTMWLFEMPVLVFFPELRRSGLGGLGYLPEWADTLRQVLGILWAVIVLILSIRAVQKISLPKAAAVTIAAMLPVTIVMLTYIR